MKKNNEINIPDSKTALMCSLSTDLESVNIYNVIRDLIMLTSSAGFNFMIYPLVTNKLSMEKLEKYAFEIMSVLKKHGYCVYICGEKREQHEKGLLLNINWGCIHSSGDHNQDIEINDDDLPEERTLH